MAKLWRRLESKAYSITLNYTFIEHHQIIQLSRGEICVANLKALLQMV